MKKYEPYTHKVTKYIRLIDFLTSKEPEYYTRVKVEFKPVNHVMITYSNTEAVYANEMKKDFGIVAERTRELGPGKYHGYTYTTKDTKYKPLIPEWAEFTEVIIPLSEWNEAHEYINKEPVIVEEVYSPEEKMYKVKNVNKKEELVLQKQRRAI